jgi:pantetheine-phosphate adenylyltransferase
MRTTHFPLRKAQGVSREGLTPYPLRLTPYGMVDLSGIGIWNLEFRLKFDMQGDKTPMEKVAIYPGSFDPITYGHIDIVERALEIFDKVIVAIANNSEKRSLFTVEERVEIVKTVFEDTPNVIVDSFIGLLVDYVANTNAIVILRGLRATSDFEYEFHMASMNRSLNSHLDTLFMMTSKDYFFVSSRTIKEVASLGGAVEGLVPDLVVRRLKQKFNLPVGKKKYLGWDD